eukprot:2206931-Rhodomonas_salina.1
MMKKTFPTAERAMRQHLRCGGCLCSGSCRQKTNPRLTLPPPLRSVRAVLGTKAPGDSAATQCSSSLLLAHQPQWPRRRLHAIVMRPSRRPCSGGERFASSCGTASAPSQDLLCGDEQWHVSDILDGFQRQVDGSDVVDVTFALACLPAGEDDKPLLALDRGGGHHLGVAGGFKLRLPGLVLGNGFDWGWAELRIHRRRRVVVHAMLLHAHALIGKVHVHALVSVDSGVMETIRFHAGCCAIQGNSKTSGRKSLEGSNGLVVFTN